MLGAMPSSRNPSVRALMVALAFALVATLAAAPKARSAHGQWPDPARFAGEIAAFAHADSVAPPPAGAIVFAGSSSIRFWHPRLAADFAPLTVVGRGFGGSTMRDLAAFLEPLVLAPRPRAVVLYEGDNDLLEGLSPAAVLAVFDSTVARIHARLPHARLYVLPVKPSPSRRALWPSALALNASFRTACAAETLLAFVDIATPMLDANSQPRPELFGPDSLHMNGKGYDVWRDSLAPVLRRREAAFER